VLKESEYAIGETESLISKIYKGSVKNLVATLFENKKLSKEDVSDLKKMFDLE
jgi:BlaI family penicillinase repressor